jgi:hypothetical protein
MGEESKGDGGIINRLMRCAGVGGRRGEVVGGVDGSWMGPFSSAEASAFTELVGILSSPSCVGDGSTPAGLPGADEGHSDILGVVCSFVSRSGVLVRGGVQG